MAEQMLDNRVIVVIGGTTGLGLAGAKACVRAGASVVVCGRSQESADRAQADLGPKSAVHVGDACDPATATAAIRHAIEKFGHFDGLYHVAGGSGRSAGDGPLHDVSDEGIDTTLRWNLDSLIYSNRAAVKAFMAAGTGGSVLNMSSVLGYRPSPKNFATHVYAAAKSAAIGFTTSCAAYYAPQNIRFNVVAPALVETPMAKRAAGDAAILKFIRGKQPLDGGRIGKPEDLDAAVVFFLSDASRYVTGQVLAVDGGWSVSEGAADG